MMVMMMRKTCGNMLVKCGVFGDGDLDNAHIAFSLGELTVHNVFSHLVIGSCNISTLIIRVRDFLVSKSFRFIISLV